jgi:hypothetical protein
MLSVARTVLRDTPTWVKAHVLLSGTYGFYKSSNGISPIVTLGDDVCVQKRELYVERVCEGGLGALVAACWLPTIPLLVAKSMCHAERYVRGMQK